MYFGKTGERENAFKFRMPGFIPVLQGFTVGMFQIIFIIMNYFAVFCLFVLLRQGFM